MDLLAHGIYGATVCSRTGLAGGRAGAGTDWVCDRGLWLALGFGLLPDLASMGPSYIAHWLSDSSDIYFRTVGPGTLRTYHWMHNLPVSLAAVALLRRVRPAWGLAALAWPLHVLMDAATHNGGKFGTMPLYPFSTWSFPGIRWWEHPRLVLGYWLALPLIWGGLWLWRRRARRSAATA